MTVRPAIDLHFHILPGVDDGPATPDESLALGRLATAEGTDCVVATPHVRDLDPATIPERVRDLQACFDREGVQIMLMPGGEVDLASAAELGDAALDAIAQGPQGRRWILLEAPLGPTPPQAVDEAVWVLRARGFGSVIAHPERSPALVGAHADALRKLARAGARVQVSASSIVGAHGDAAREAGLALLRSGLADAIASDAHSSERPPRLVEAAGILAREGLPPPLIQRLFQATPRELIQEGVSNAGACTPCAPPRRESAAAPRASANRA
jgi:protein-tyrosine phosphatase